ncbi:hypothetical protein ACW9IO_17625 [Pseudomonas azotoformans]
MSTITTGQPNANGPSGPTGTLVLDPPKILDVLPDGLLPAQYTFTDLRVSIEKPWAVLPVAGRLQFVVFEWHVRGASSVDAPAIQLPSPLTDADFPLDYLTIPKEFLLNSAVVDVSFRIHNTRPDSPSADSSGSTTIEIDRDNPGGGALLLPAIFPVDPITQLYLDNHPLVPMEIPSGYLDRKVGDQVLMYFSDKNALPTGMPTLISPPLVSSTGPIFVDVPREVFRSYPGALWLFCFYRLKDRADNVNPLFSQVAQVGLQTDLPPITYRSPRFPQSESHPSRFMTCSTLPAIWFGVEVLIEPDTNILHGDLITMRFQGYGQYPDQNPDPNTVETLTHYWDGVADASGYLFRILDVERVIRPLKDSAGGEASFMVRRNGIDIGRSSSRFVPFDRVVPVSPKPPSPIFCWIYGNGPEP